MAEVIVVGGGVIGLSIAWELARHGVAVGLLEQGTVGREASWAGAGMLPPGNSAEAKSPEAKLRAASHGLWPDWSARLREETGIENGYLRCGGLTVSLAQRDPDFDAALAGWIAEGVAIEQTAEFDARERWPFLGSEVRQAFFLREMGQVRNPRHLKALEAACAQAGVDIFPGQPVVEIDRGEDRVLAVQTPQRRWESDEFVFAGGAWSTHLVGLAGIEFPVEPVRGQIVLLESRPLPFRCIIEQGRRYLVPRADGKILVGSTEERVGFLKANTAEAVSELIRFAVGTVPALSSAKFDQAWSGLRPYYQGGLPMIGRVPGLKNASIAAGHFRSGLQLSPITAVMMRRVILGEAVERPAG
jgi:glycine oxidase